MENSMKTKRYQIMINAILILVTLIIVLPFVLVFLSSLTDENVLIRNGYSFFPQKWGLDAYLYLWETRKTLLQAYKMTFLVTLIGVSCGLTITTLFAYGLSKRSLPGRSVIAFMVFFSMLFNGGLIPSYLMWTQTFHIKDTIFALLVPNLMMNGFSVIVMRSFFQSSIPEELLEAAKLDGAGEWKILAWIVLPLSKPILSTITLLTGLGYWNDWMNGMYYLVGRTDLFTIQNVLNRMISSMDFLRNSNLTTAIESGIRTPSIGIRMAIAVIALIPILVVYPFLQKGFVKGIVIGSVKG